MNFKPSIFSGFFQTWAWFGIFARASLQAAILTVFLDNGTAPGSTNTARPFSTGDREAT